MRYLSNAIAGAAGMMILFGALAAMPDTAHGRGRGPQDGPALGAPAPDLGACGDLHVDEGNRVAFSVYAEGVQIYRWSGTAWALLGPEATLYADASGNGVVGTHYAGPTWESNSGSYVKGANPLRCTPDPDSIQWLRLDVSETGGNGIFDGVSRIQRVNTSGGKAPATPGATIGEEARVPYTTDYYFYKIQ